MTSMENIEVYIPKEACVKTIPFRSLTPSVVRKISLHLCQNTSEAPEKQIVTCISPVELREKAKADSSEVKRSCMTKITPGQFWLPVVSSSVKAYKILKNILPAHKPPIQLSVPEQEDAPCSISKDSLQKNSFIVFNNQIFLSVKRPRCKKVSSQNITSLNAFPVSSIEHHQEDAQTRDAPRSEQSVARMEVEDAQSSRLSHRVSEVTPERHCTSTEGPKDAEMTSDSANSAPKPPEDLEPNQTAFSFQMSNPEPNILHQSQSPTHTSSEEPKTAGGEEETQENVDTPGFLPSVESCLAFDFQLLAKEEKISHLRARLKQKEAALSILKSKPTDQV